MGERTDLPIPRTKCLDAMECQREESGNMHVCSVPRGGPSAPKGTRCGDLPDRALVECLLKGNDQAAAEILYARHTSSVMGFVLPRVSWDRSNAEDVVQETWMRAFRSLGKFRWQSSLLSWLCAIALNRVRDRVRSRKELPEWFLNEEPAVSRQSDILLKIDLDRALDTLPRGERSVFVLHDIEGLSHPEVGRALSVSTGTSKSQLHRARTRMRRVLSAERN